MSYKLYKIRLIFSNSIDRKSYKQECLLYNNPNIRVMPKKSHKHKHKDKNQLFKINDKTKESFLFNDQPDTTFQDSFQNQDKISDHQSSDSLNETLQEKSQQLQEGIAYDKLTIVKKYLSQKGIISISQIYYEQRLNDIQLYSSRQAGYNNYLIKEAQKRKRKLLNAQRLFENSNLKLIGKSKIDSFEDLSKLYQCSCGKVYYNKLSYYNHQKKKLHKSKNTTRMGQLTILKNQLEIITQDNFNEKTLIKLFREQIEQGKLKHIQKQMIHSSRESLNFLKKHTIQDNEINIFSVEFFNLNQKLQSKFKGKSQIYHKNMALREHVSLFLIYITKSQGFDDYFSIYKLIYTKVILWIDQNYEYVIEKQLDNYQQLNFMEINNQEQEQFYSQSNDCYLIRLFFKHYLDTEFNRKNNLSKLVIQEGKITRIALKSFLHYLENFRYILIL